MKPRQVLVLTLILALLGLAVFVQQMQKPAELATEEYVPLDLSFNAADVTQVEITKPKGEKEEEYVQLLKEEKGWKLQSLFGARADQQKIEEFLKTIREAKGEVRARDKALWQDFGLGENQAYKIKLSTKSGNLLTFYLGKKRVGYDTLFVRKEGSDVVYLTNADLFGKMGIYGDPATDSLNHDHWADTVLVRFESEKVRKMQVRRFKEGKEILTADLAREAGQPWQVASGAGAPAQAQPSQANLPFELNHEKVNQFLDSLKTWRASKVLDPKAKDYGFNQPVWRMNLTLDGGEEITVTAGTADETAKAYPMQVSTEPVVFQLTHYYFENMDADYSRFFPENPLEVDPEKTEKLVIHADKKEMPFSPKEKTWEVLTAYLNELKNFRPVRILHDPAEQGKVRSPARYWIEVKGEGKDAKTIDVGDLISEEVKEYAAQRRNFPLSFAISESSFKSLFENLDRLAEPPPAPAPAEPNMSQEKKS